MSPPDTAPAPSRHGSTIRPPGPGSLMHLETPLIRSSALSRWMGSEVWLKLEALQPTGSFKARGIGALCRQVAAGGATRLVSSSAGNAGFNVAWAGRKLGIAVTVVVPQTTPEMMRRKIGGQGAQIEVQGASWDDADARARRLAEEPGAVRIHPFDHPAVWEGNGTLLEEVAKAGLRPDSIVLSVGGGGLFAGVMETAGRLGWRGVKLLACETEGAASLAASVRAGRLVTLPRIDSVAATLGARRVASRAFELAQRPQVACWTVSDRLAIDACLAFASDHRLLVEPACGAALAAVYQRAKPLRGARSILVVVCGGVGVSLELLRSWDAKLPRR